jgi:hypothetical protein
MSWRILSDSLLQQDPLNVKNDFASGVALPGRFVLFREFRGSFVCSLKTRSTNAHIAKVNSTFWAKTLKTPTHN